jgi:PAS domain S-box-containing protein
MSSSTNNKYRQKKSLNIISFYRIVTFILLPLFIVYLVLDPFLNIPVNDYHKFILFYTVIMLTILFFLSKIEFFRKKFHLIHTVFVSGIMLINFFWYFNEQDFLATASLLVSANLIGIVLIHPKVTAWFYACSFIIFTSFAAYFQFFQLEISFMLLTVAIVITLFSYWRHGLRVDLKNARKTFQGMFDSSNQIIYVLSQDLDILDVNIGAEKFLKEKGIGPIDNKKFTDIFYYETARCAESMDLSIAECRKTGHSKFQSNCGITGSNEILPVEYRISKGQYFEQEVYILNARIIKEQKEYEKTLIENKDNITKVLENISAFVFNITYDVEERYRHKVNYVSSRVENVYGYSEDEYISLVKSGRILKDVHPDDVAKAIEKFEELLQIHGTSSWRFRMKVYGKWRWIEEKITVEKTENTNFLNLFGKVKDITNEVKKAEKLRESEKKYKDLFESNLAGVYKTHVSGQILECNSSFAKILGFKTATELLHKNIKDLYYDSSDRSKYLSDLRKSKALNNHLSMIRRQDGRRLILNNNVSLISDDDGEFNWIVGTVIDVTELHETGLALTHSEEKYRLLFEESNNAILLLVIDDEDSFVIDVNEQAQKVFGLQESEFLGKKLNEISAKKYSKKEQTNNILHKLKDGEKVESEWIFNRSSDEKFFAEVSFTAVNLEEERVAQVVIKDISERKTYEAEILESRLSFKNIVDRSPVGIMIFTDDKLNYLNPQGEEIYKKVLKSNAKTIQTIFPDSSQFLLADLIKEAENKISSYTEIALGTESKNYSINVVKTIYEKQKANVLLLQDISLQNEYNTQKLRAEVAEETATQLQTEIEKHKVTQATLSEFSSRLQSLLDSAANLFILTLDENFNVVGFNKKSKDFIENRLHSTIQLGDNFLKIFPTEKYAIEVIEERFRRVLNGEYFEMISHFPTDEGEAWMEAFMNPIKIKGKEVSEFSFIAHDITERVENKEKLANSEESHKAILVALPDILFKVDREGMFTDYRASSESNERAFFNFIETDKVKGLFVHEVFKDKELAQEIKENIEKTFLTNELITQNYSLTLESKEEKTMVHYENRYSKLNENELVIISRNITDTIEYESKLIESVKEKEILLKEVHHRVKNNLQVINSILNLQSSYVKDDETLQIIIESQNRIRSMSYIHESLYQTKDFSHISFDAYITNLVQNLVHSYQVSTEKIKLKLDVDPINLALDQAIPCGLILNELITNAMKYAYPNNKGGEISISVKEKHNKISMSIADFGVGLPKGFKIDDSETLGLSLVDTLIDQVDGQLSLKTEGGTEFLIIFEKQEF